MRTTFYEVNSELSNYLYGNKERSQRYIQFVDKKLSSIDYEYEEPSFLDKINYFFAHPIIKKFKTLHINDQLIIKRAFLNIEYQDFYDQMKRNFKAYNKDLTIKNIKKSITFYSNEMLQKFIIMNYIQEKYASDDFEKYFSLVKEDPYISSFKKMKWYKINPKIDFQKLTNESQLEKIEDRFDEFYVDAIAKMKSNLSKLKHRLIAKKFGEKLHLSLSERAAVMSYKLTAYLIEKRALQYYMNVEKTRKHAHDLKNNSSAGKKHLKKIDSHFNKIKECFNNTGDGLFETAGIYKIRNDVNRIANLLLEDNVRSARALPEWFPKQAVYEF